MPSIAAFILIALPWLNPFSPGPSPAVAPLLFSWACVAVLLGLGRFAPERMAKGLVEATAGAWLCAALFSAELGLLQYFGVTEVFGPWVNRAELGEAYANLRQRNQYASLTNIGLAALLWWQARDRAAGVLLFSPAQQGVVPLWQALLALAAAALLGVGNAASSSRTGLLQGLMVLALACYWGAWRQPAARRLLLVAAVAYGVAAFALPRLAGLDPAANGILARLHEGGPACASRLTLWGNVLHLIAQKPWFGWGWGELDFAHFITLYPGARFCDILDNAHNLPLHLAVELGVPVAVLVCAGGLWLAWHARPWRETDATRQMAWTVLAVILLHSLLEYPLWYGPFQMALGLSILLLWRTPPGWYRCATGPAHLAWAAVSRTTVAVSAALVLAFVTHAAWDYYRISQIYLPPAERAAAYREHTLEKLSSSWLFRQQVRFAELSITALTRDNAEHIHELASTSLHFSPEPRVIEMLIESAVLLGRDDEAGFYLQRYRAAFPQNHARWAGRR